MEDPDDTLAEAFWSVARMLRHRSSETTAPMGVTPAQARALMVLRRHGQMRLNELSHHLRIVPRSATEVVDALEAAGLVSRSPDLLDRRAVLVALTEPGAELTGRLRSARAAEGEAFFGRLGEQDRETLGRILRDLREAT
jgi:DNA-binding MarR family transcriptional regulator